MREIASLKVSLEKQQLTLKRRLWWENCNLQLKPEEEIENREGSFAKKH